MACLLLAALALLPPLSGAIVRKELSDSMEVQGHMIDQRGGDRPFRPLSDGILVFSEGKTGTTSLQDSAGDMMVPPCHASGNGASAIRAVKCHDTSCAGSFLKNRPEHSRIWVIGTVRDAFSMYPSSFFQNLLKRYTPEELKNAPVNQLLMEFHQKSVWANRWWTDHYYEAFGINVTAYPFDFQNKLLHLTHSLNNRRLDILIVRVEDSPDWETVLKPFFPDMKLSHSNSGGDKIYAEKYREFMSSISWTDKDIEQILQTESMNHFYTPVEREQFLLRSRSSSLRISDNEDLRAEEDNFINPC